MIELPLVLKRALFILTLVAVTSFISSCLNTQAARTLCGFEDEYGVIRWAPPEFEAEAKKFLPSPQNAMIYVVRVKEFRAHCAPFEAWLDGANLGIMPVNSFLALSVPPGEHTISANMVMNMWTRGARSKRSSAAMSFYPGRKYFFSLQFAGQFSGFRADLKQIPEKDGKALVREAEMLLSLQE